MTHKNKEKLRQALREAAIIVPAGSRYRHYRDTEGCYVVLGHTILEATDEAAVCYIPESDPDLEFTRPLSDFTAAVELDGLQTLRFEPIA